MRFLKLPCHPRLRHELLCKCSVEGFTGRTSNASDKNSFHHSPILSQQEWENLLIKTWTDAESFAILVEQLPESKLWETFPDEKYGNYYINIHGIIEHCHYHLGQIVFILILN